MHPNEFLRPSKDLHWDAFHGWLAGKRGLPPKRLSRRGILQPWDPKCLMTAHERSVHKTWSLGIGAYEAAHGTQETDLFLANLSQSDHFQPKIAPLRAWPTLLRSSGYFLRCGGGQSGERFLHPLEALALQCLPVCLAAGQNVAWASVFSLTPC